MAGLFNLKTADLLLRLALGGIFIAASVDKILHPAAFASIVRDYKVLPDTLSNLAALVLPWLELVLGVLLLAGVWRASALVLANLLLLLFWTTLLVNYFRGIDVGCGCFSTSAAQQHGMFWYVVRDGLFVVLGLGAALVYRKHSAQGEKACASPFSC